MSAPPPFPIFFFSYAPDEVAYSAANLQEEHISFYYEDWIPILNKAIEENWTRL